MTDQPQDQALEGTEPAQPADRTGTVTTEDGLLFDAPDDVDEGIATGYAVYNRTLGRYVGPVVDKKPSKADANKRVAKGHTTAVVRV